MMKPMDVDEVTMAFPAEVVGTYLPAEKDIPEEFWDGRASPPGEWTHIVNTWFTRGLNPDVKFSAKEGIDARKAFRHCAAIMGSFQPKHEHKIAGVAYLLSEFFEKIEDWNPIEEQTQPEER